MKLMSCLKDKRNGHMFEGSSPPLTGGGRVCPARRKFYLSNLSPEGVTVTGIAASSPVSKAFLGLTSFPNLSLRLIGNQHDYSMPGTSTFIMVCSQGHKLTIYCHVSYHLCLPLCKSGKVAWGIQRAERFWRCSDRKAKAVSFWNILH